MNFVNTCFHEQLKAYSVHDLRGLISLWSNRQHGSRLFPSFKQRDFGEFYNFVLKPNSYRLCLRAAIDI